MKLFNKLYLLIFVVFAFACDPYEDTFQEIEDSVSGPIANIEIELTENDYKLLNGVEGAENISKYGNFDNEEDVKEFIPIILSKKYPLFDNKSLVTVNYDYYRGYSSNVRPYSNAVKFKFSVDEYAAISNEAGVYLFVNSKNDVPNVLDQQKPNAEDGDVLIVAYDYADIDYNAVSAQTVYTEDFEGLSDLTGFDTYSELGAQQWGVYSSSSGYQAANMSGYAGSNMPNEDWLVLPEVDLNGVSSEVSLNVSQVLNFLNDGVIEEDIAIKIATDYDGNNLATANWENLSLDQWPSGSNYDLVEGKASLANYIGQSVSIAFFYRSTADFAANWRVVEVAIEDGAAIETQTIETFYEFNNGVWSIPGEAYYLQAGDYNAMGAPGKYDNFSNSAEPDDFIPTFLAQKYPYAQEDNQQIVVYKYFSDGETQNRGDLYTYFDGNWNVYESKIVEQLQFAKEENVWVPDNTIALTLSKADYIAIGAIEVDNGNAARGENLADYGSFYQNFPGGDTHWKTEEIAAVLSQYLKIKYPNLGVDQKFTITYIAYTGSAVEVQMNLIQNDEGVYVVNE